MDLYAWIDQEDDGYTASFIATEAIDSDRAPAERHFDTEHEARLWVEDEAAEISASVRWRDE